MKIIVEAKIEAEGVTPSPGLTATRIHHELLGAIKKLNEDLAYAVGPSAIVHEFTVRTEP